MPSQISPWIEHVPDEWRYDALNEDTEADVVVVGAGIVGITTAYLLAKAGKRVVLVDRNHVAMGDSGYTTAFLTRDPDTLMSDVAERYGRAFAIDVMHAAESAQQLLYRIIREEKIDCDFQECASFYGSEQKDDKQLDAEWSIAHEADKTAVRAGADELRQHTPTMQSAIILQHEGRFDARKFCLGLLATETGKRIAVYEETDVRDIQSRQDGVTLQTSGGTVTAAACVVATGRPHPALTALATSVRMRTTYAMAARYSAEAPISDNIFWDTDEPYQYYRRLDAHTVILGGADQGTDEAALSAAAIDPHTTLKSWLSKHLPGEFEVTHAWSGNIYETEDGLPLVGALPERPNVFVATGFSGNGMVMGVMAADMLAATIAEGRHRYAQLFAVKRLQKAGDKEKTAKAQKHGSAAGTPTWPTWVFAAVYLVLLALPAWFFFSSRDGLATLQQPSLTEASAVLFPLFGLYAFLLVWVQAILGSLMPFWRKVIPWVERFHRVQGAFALLFAILHPLLIVMWVGIGGYLAKDFVGKSQGIYVVIGQIQLVIIMLTAGTALLMRIPWLRTRWRIVHFVNYSLVPLIWVHSWFLGSDVQGQPLQYLWYLVAVTYIAAATGRVLWARRTRGYLGESASAGKDQDEPDAPADEGFVSVAKTDEVPEGRPHCVSVGSQDIALFKVGDKYFAIDNICSHAGGPLCKGKFEGNIVTCPLHFSKFDVTTGAVLSPPARVPQKRYEVKVSGQDIQIKIS